MKIYVIAFVPLAQMAQTAQIPKMLRNGFKSQSRKGVIMQNKKRGRLGEEWYHCRAFYKWICLHPFLKDFTIKIAHEGKRTQIEGNLLNLIGWKRGFPDYLIFYPTSTYHLLAIEIKPDEKAKVSDEQHCWIRKLSDNNYYATIGYGWQDAVDKVKKYLLT